MAWLETIRLLAAKNRIDDLLRSLPGLLAAWGGVGLEERVALYHQQSVDSDLLVCIRWDQGPAPGKTREGLLLAEYLTGFGLVDHAVWEQDWGPEPSDRL